MAIHYKKRLGNNCKTNAELEESKNRVLCLQDKLTGLGIKERPYT
jgi:hypothetical protein